MNRLILIGNGFDLAHGLKTSYRDFIHWYMWRCFRTAAKEKIYEDDLITIKTHGRYYTNERQFERWVESYLSNYRSKKRKVSVAYSFQRPVTSTEVFDISFKTQLLEVLLDRCVGARWVDIESEYYSLLRNVLKMEKENDKEPYLKSLNKSLSNLIEHLKFYLKELEPASYIMGYESMLRSEILKDELYPKADEGYQQPEETYILNFNYTNTIAQYVRSINNMVINVNYIHGRLDNDSYELVLGFGDELDVAYKQMEEDSGVSGYFDYIKSFWYLRHTHYRELVDFLDSNDFQVYVLGHSCGLSDRTMLQMVFEHKLCRSVKIYYHDSNGADNYVSITHDISRHFTDKGLMRKRIVSKERSRRMPQHDD